MADEDLLAGASLLAPYPVQAQPTPGLTTGAQQFGATFRRGNALGSVAAMWARGGLDARTPDPTFSPLPLIKGTKYEARRDAFVDDGTEADVWKTMARLDAEDRDREIVDQTPGALGVLYGLTADVLDPTNYLAVGGIIKTGKGGYSLLKSAASIGAMNAASVAAQEAVLQTTQLTRTADEGVINVASGALFGAILGGGAAKFMSNAERRLAEQLLDRDRAMISRHAGQDVPEPKPVEPGAAPSLRPAEPVPAGEVRAGEAMPEAPMPAGDGFAKAAGAAAADTRTLDLVSYGLNRIPGVRSVVEKMSPTLRVYSSGFVEGKRFLADLAESALTFAENAAGVPTSFSGPPVDRLARLHINQARYETESGIDDLWMRHRFGDPGTPEAAGFIRTTLAKVGSDIQALRGAVEDGKLTHQQFLDEIGRAMRRNDQHAIPEVAEAAKLVRAKVFEPWKKRITSSPQLREAFGWPEDIDPKTADSYFMRVWDREQIRARKPELAGRVEKWLTAEQTRKAQIKDRLQSLSDQMRTVRRNLGKVEGRLATLDAKEKALEAATRERVVELNAADKRAAKVTAAHAAIQEDLSALDEFVGAMRETLRDPDAIVQLDRLEEEVRALRKAERASTVPLSGLAEIDKGEIGATFQGDFQTAAEVFTGRRNMPKPPSFIGYVVNNGGIAEDVGGEVAAALRDLKRPGLIRKDRRALPGVTDGNQVVRSLDDWGEYLHEQFPHAFPERPTVNQVLDVITEAAQGRDPWWFHVGPDGRRNPALDVRDQVEYLSQLFDHLDVPHPGTMKDLAKVLNGERGISLEDLEREMAAMDAAGAAIPPGIEAREAEARLAAWHQARDEVKALIEQARRDKAAGERSAGKAAVRSNEAGVAVTRSESRFEELAARADRQAMVRDILETAQANGRREWERLTSQIEGEVRAWQGDSAADALAALKARDEAERVRALKMEAGVYEGRGGRLTSADDAVNRAVKRIIRSDRDLTPEDIRNRSYEIIDRIISSPNGRLPYETSSVTSFGKAVPTSDVRGPLAAREFMIPDELVEDFLDSNAERIAATYLHTMVPDVLVTERFGDVNATEAFRRINDEANRKIEAATSDAERTRIGQERDRVIDDVGGVLQRVRGLYALPADELMRNVGRVSRAVRTYNILTDMGGVVLNSLSELSGPIFRFGFQKVFGEAWVPFFASLRNPEHGYRAAGRQYRAAGIAADIHLNTRLSTLGDVVEEFRPESRLERTLSAGANMMQLINLQAPWTDMGKTMASVVAGNEILRATKAVAAGTQTERQLAMLAESNIDRATAATIWREFEKTGEIRDGIHLPNTADWRSRGAREAFEAAVAREADIAIVTPGQEKPFWLSRPIGALIGQYKTFTAGATERVLIANLQRSDARALSGLMAAVTGGMLSYAAYSLASNRPLSDNPADWVREGISRSGVLGWLEEANTFSSKFTGNRLDMYRLIGSDRPLSKYSSRSALGQMLGPTAGKIEGLIGGMSHALGGQWGAADSTALRRIVPFQNLIGLRLALDQVERGVNEALGVPAKPVR